jgi:hypothetical protein
MFSILRFILVIGAIFYYSPVRQGGAAVSLDALLGPKKSGSEAKAKAAPADETSTRLETVWQALPDGAKRAAVDKILSTSGLVAAGSKPVDTLQPGDRQAASRPSSLATDAIKPRS